MTAIAPNTKVSPLFSLGAWPCSDSRELIVNRSPTASQGSKPSSAARYSRANILAAYNPVTRALMLNGDGVSNSASLVQSQVERFVSTESLQPSMGQPV